MTSIVRASHPAELLRLVPVLAGFTPRRSLVLVPFCEGRSRGAMRLDLPPDAGDLGAYAAQAIGMLCRVPGADATAIFVYDDELPCTAGLPRAQLVAEVRDRLAVCGFELIEALCVRSDAWADYRDEQQHWHPLAEIPTPPELPGLGDLAGDQRSGSALPDVDPVQKAAVAEAFAALDPVLGRRVDAPSQAASGGREHPLATAAAAVLDDLPTFLERMLAGHEPDDPFDLAVLAWCLNRPMLRDVGLIQWARGFDDGVRTLAAQLTFRNRGTHVPDALAATLLGQGPRPDPDRLGRALTLIRRVSSCAPEEVRAGPLVAAAWLAWALGRSTHASAYIELALVSEPGHTMATLLHRMIETGMLPDWAFDMHQSDLSTNT